MIPSTVPSEKAQWEVISESRTGLVARQIFTLVSAHQGPAGILATEAMQLVQSMETPKRRKLIVHAIWSPDGHLSRADIERSRASIQGNSN